MIPDWLLDMIQESNPITEEKYLNLHKTKYTSGKEIKIGDYFLVGMLIEPIENQEEKDIPEINIKIIYFEPREIGTIYEKDEKYSSHFPKSKIPYLKQIDKKT